MRCAWQGSHATSCLKLEFVLVEPPDPPAPRAPAGESGESGPFATVEVPDFDLCPRFTAHVLAGFVIGPSASVVARRLVLAGMRPLNNVVDASNYVMLELGQPTHPYDLDRVARHTLRARAGRPGEVVVTLDGVERRVAARSVGPGDDLRDCLICDGDDVAIGIGGVMGGASTEISESTRRILLEAAYFTPMAIARTSSRLGLRTEASVRFERGCDPYGIDRSVRRLCEVLAQSAGPGFGVLPGSVDVRGVSATTCSGAASHRQAELRARVCSRRRRDCGISPADRLHDHAIGAWSPRRHGPELPARRHPRGRRDRRGRKAPRVPGSSEADATSSSGRLAERTPARPEAASQRARTHGGARGVDAVVDLSGRSRTHRSRF